GQARDPLPGERVRRLRDRRPRLACPPGPVSAPPPAPCEVSTTYLARLTLPVFRCGLAPSETREVRNVDPRAADRDLENLSRRDAGAPRRPGRQARRRRRA